MAFDKIIVDISDDVATITLNRPDAMNALNGDLLRELCTALEDADASDKVRCIIITGSEKAFAAGAEISEMADKSLSRCTRSAFLRMKRIASTGHANPLSQP